MDKWQPLQPTTRLGANSGSSAIPSSSSSASASAPVRYDAYAPPPAATRAAPPARPHPPISQLNRRSILPWSKKRQYAAAPVSAESSEPAGADDSSPKSAALQRSGSKLSNTKSVNALGRFPPEVHECIAGFLSLDDLARYTRVCRSLARIIAQDRVWRSRADRISWRPIPGLQVIDLVQLRAASASADETSKQPTSAAMTKDGHLTVASSGTPDGKEDEWGDFAGQGSSRTSFSGTTPKSAQSRPTPSSLFSFNDETTIPSATASLSYKAIQSYYTTLRPYVQSLQSAPEYAENSLLFSAPGEALSAWGPLEQSHLLTYLMRAVLPAPHGAGLFRKDVADEQLIDAFLRLASMLSSQLLSYFTASSDRRSDALRAASHGATGIQAAVDRAEGDMRAFAVAIWELGRENRNLVRFKATLNVVAGDDTGDSLWGTPANAGMADEGNEAKVTWMENAGDVTAALKAGDPTANIVAPKEESSSNGDLAAVVLDFTPMDKVMAALVDRISTEGALVARIFPPEQGVLLEWAREVANQLLAEYIVPLVESARTHSIHLYLRACAAAFTQSLRLSQSFNEVSIPAVLPRPSTAAGGEVTTNGESTLVQGQEASEWQERFRKTHTKEKYERAVLEAWDVILEEYLSEERDWVRGEMEAVAQRWDEDLANESVNNRVDAAFLTAANPAAVKRSVLSGFKDVLLLPVTVVPRAAVGVGGAAFRTVGKGVSHLNPLKWQTTSVESSSASAPHKQAAKGGVLASPSPHVEKGYIDFSSGGAAQDGGDDDSDDDFINEKSYNGGPNGNGELGMEADWNEEVQAWKDVAGKVTEGQKRDRKKIVSKMKSGDSLARKAVTTQSGPPGSVGHLRTASASKTTLASMPPSRPETPLRSNASTPRPPPTLQSMQLLLSLETALQMIHLNRDSLKRIATFSELVGPGNEATLRIREEIEEVASSFLQCLGDRHILPGFRKGTAQIQSWKPEQLNTEKDKKGGGAAQVSATGDADEKQEAQTVEPLVHFFELVHVGDTIAQMVQVYFDQELSTHIDRTDFLNSVVREKKRFESALDEAVAGGLNAGVDLLMGQVDHIIATRQESRDFYPESSDADLDLANPTKACALAIDCLKVHCQMLVGCTDKTVLEVFWQEISLRLHSIICKHLKRQIISLSGGFKVIADINAYHGYIASLRQPSIMPYFDALKMLGNVYVIENPKELAQLVRDASVFRGTLTPDDVYEFLQARSDFKSIEKAIDQEMYGFKIAEDCVVM